MDAGAVSNRGDADAVDALQDQPPVICTRPIVSSVLGGVGDLTGEPIRNVRSSVGEIAA
jgi:hypothetical protein